jgi:hypothetical protein
MELRHYIKEYNFVNPIETAEIPRFTSDKIWMLALVEFLIPYRPRCDQTLADWQQDIGKVSKVMDQLLSIIWTTKIVQASHC